MGTPVTAPIRCQPWCTCADGHADELFVEDQRCEAPHRAVSGTDDTTVTVFAQQHLDQAPMVSVWVYGERTDEVIRLPLGEAVALAANLSKAVAEALGYVRTPPPTAG